jgi:hypothetical protein
LLACWFPLVKQLGSEEALGFNVAAWRRNRKEPRSASFESA